MKQVQKPVQMCCLTLNYTNYILPADKGMKVVALMQSAVPCNEDYEDRQFIYRATEEPTAVEFKLIQPSQLRGPKVSAAILQIGHEPLKIGGRT